MASKKDSASGWTGWVAFAAILLILVGSFHAVAGLVALFRDDVLVVGLENIWIVSYTTWGWVHILGGLLAVWAGSSLANGNAFGRIVAVVIATLSAVANMAFVPAQPFWALLMIAVDVCIIYAVTVHGAEMKELE